jgi:hypothetical protein
MILEKCPTTKIANDYINRRIIKEIPELDLSKHDKFLSLKSYIFNKPQVFYMQKAYKFYLAFLNNLKKENKIELVGFLVENEKGFDQCLKNLNEINNIDIHDCILPDDNIELIRIIDNKIHFNYLRLIEGTLYKLILLVATFYRIKRGKSTTGLKLYNCIEELSESEFSFINDHYSNTIRNGIAHNGVTYKEGSIIYKGQKGKPIELSTESIIKYFDKMVDTCNGLALGLKVFIIQNREFFVDNSIRIPNQFLIDEIKAQANAPRWEVVDCLENTILNNKKQLNIYTNNSLLGMDEVNYFAFRTAVIAEYYASGYDRYFFSLKSKYSLPGWAAFNGLILKNGRLKSKEIPVGYENVLEDKLLYFKPRINIPKRIRKLIDFKVIVQNSFKYQFKDIKEENFGARIKLELRDAKPFYRDFNLINNDPSIVLSGGDTEKQIEFIRKKTKKIIRFTKRKSRPFLKYWIHRLFPTRYIRVTVYDHNMRKRQLRGSGLTKNLICSISVNKSKKIENIVLHPYRAFTPCPTSN